MFKKFLKSKSSVQQDDHANPRNEENNPLDEERSVNQRTPVEPSKSLSEPSVPPEVYQHLCHVFRGLIEGYVKTSYGVDSKKAIEISYTIEEKFFESYVQEYYKDLLKVFHPDDIKLISTVLMRTEFIMYEQALKTLTSMKSKSLYDMCEKVTGFDSEDSTVH